MPDPVVLTPGGFRSRSLVHAVAQDEGVRLQADAPQLFKLATRAVRALPPREALAVVPARIGLRGAPAGRKRPQVLPALSEGWIAYAWWDTGGASINRFTTTWTVPGEPITNAGQTIFLFNGIQNTGENYGILQPVLQWGPSAAGGGPRWTIASWYVTSGGDAFHTDLIDVNVGDTLVGVMEQTGASGDLRSYTCFFEGIAGTRLDIEDIAPLHWANETLEAYDVTRCSDYPAPVRTRFSNIEITVGASEPALSWTAEDAVTDCGQHTVVVSNANGGGSVDLFYRADQPIDAALYSGSKCYFFRGSRYVRVTRGDTGPGVVDEGYPKPISTWGWGTFGSGGIDAALYSGSKCYFFKGNQYIRVTRSDTGPGTVDPGYPKPISTWGWGSFGASGIDAALNSGSKCYFFKGNQYIRVTRSETGPGTVDPGYPKPISTWGWGSFGATGIDAALFSGAKCYFFKGNQYIRVTRSDTGPGTVDPGYPAPMSNWYFPPFV